MLDVAFVALGSNLGDREGHLAQALMAIAAIPGVRIIAESSIEETSPIGPVAQGPFLNQMVAVETNLRPRQLLAQLHAIERAQGRVRDVRWGPRTLDLDIVQYEAQHVDEPDLQVPHPALGERDFWGRELCELRRLAALDEHASEHDARR